MWHKVWTWGYLTAKPVLPTTLSPDQNESRLFPATQQAKPAAFSAGDAAVFRGADEDGLAAAVTRLARV